MKPEVSKISPLLLKYWIVEWLNHYLDAFEGYFCILVCFIWTSKQDDFGSLKPPQASGYWLNHSNIHHYNVRGFIPDT